MKVRLLLTALILLVLSVSSAFASNYPNDYGHQKAFFVQEGPVVFGLVQSGVMTGQYVIGYKKSGPLGRFSSLNVLIRTVLKSGTTIEKNLPINREWNDTGLMSESLPAYYLNPKYFEGDPIERVELAFHLNGQWDSRHGQNYCFSTRDIYGHGGRKVETYTSTYPSGSLNIDVWNFIVGLMRS